MEIKDPAKRRVVGGVDTHKVLHAAAVVDERDRVLGSQVFGPITAGGLDPNPSPLKAAQVHFRADSIGENSSPAK